MPILPKGYEEIDGRTWFDFTDVWARAPGHRSDKPAPLKLAIDSPSPLLGEGQRGIVLSQCLHVWTEGHCIESCIKDPTHEDINLALLFFDYIDVPTEAEKAWNNHSTHKELEKCGVLNRTHFHIKKGNDSRNQAFGMAQREVFEHRSSLNPGRWTVGRAPWGSAFRRSDLHKGNGVQLKLYRSLLSPDYTVPVHEILEFRDRRRSELIGLRSHIERLTLSINSNPELGLALVRELEDLDRALADYLKVAKETKFSLRVTDLEAEIDVGAGLFAAAGAFSAGLDLTASALAGLGGAIGSATLTTGAGLKKRKQIGRPFEYVARFHREVYPGSRHG